MKRLYPNNLNQFFESYEVVAVPVVFRIRIGNRRSDIDWRKMIVLKYI